MGVDVTIFSPSFKIYVDLKNLRRRQDLKSHSHPPYTELWMAEAASPMTQKQDNLIYKKRQPNDLHTQKAPN